MQTAVAPGMNLRAPPAAWPAQRCGQPARNLDASPSRKDAPVAQTKTSQRTPGRFAANREQARRGGLVSPSPTRQSAPLTAAAGGRGRRGNLSIISFFRDVRSELRKVVWPTRRETLNLTAVVLTLSAVVGAFLGVVDFVFQELFRFLLSLAGSGGF